ncbi:sensor domain-containing protein [Bacillus sp. SG-1]|uniref:sensor domain-containing protein n=1 Tax=Bacillus sp. SG-1 TaxID=161544 RepID=UPI0012EACF51|nr:EAL domain-containing protein [Bacillus sp. SG-1]
MVYYSLSEYVLSIGIATIAGFFGITLIRKMREVENGQIKVHIASLVFGAIIYFSYLYGNMSGIEANVGVLLGIGFLIFNTWAVNTTINTICLREISFFKLIFSSIIFASCISLVNMIDIWSEMVEHDLKMNILLFISANILLAGNVLATIRFIRQIRSLERVGFFWILFGSFAIGMAFASIRFTLFSSITLFSTIDLFTNRNIPIFEWVYLNNTLLPLMINIFALVFLELVPGLFSEIHSKEQQELIIENKRRYETLFDNQAVAIFTLDPKGKILKLNNAVQQLTGYPIDQLKKGSSFAELIHESKEDEFSSYIMEAVKGSSQMFETKISTSEGKYIDVQITLIPIFVKEKLANINILAKDITEVIQTREQIQHLAYHDSLTGLPNRFQFVKELQQRIETSKLPAAVCFLDLDRFKVINDVLGHQTGDRLLLQLSERFTSFVKEDVKVARMGGDEFTFLFPEIPSMAELENKIEELMALIQTPFQIEKQELFVTGSMGISIYPNDSDTVEDLMKYADVAMYRSKEKGKNTFEFYHQQNDEESSKKLALEKDIRKAMKEKEFEIVYQPQVKVSTGKIFGVEALLRWNHPAEGLITPNKFISLAEENGLIHELGEWVLRESCRQVNQWHNEGYSDLQLSVNISLKQLYHQNFISTVKRVIDEEGFSTSLLDLEITESMAMKDIEYAKLIFNQLRALGISISIDDFGTGYSSLNHIKNFPIDRVKIDGSFIRDVPGSAEAAIIIKTIIAMTRNLNLLSIAEHVETKEQYEFLQEINCDEIQGYYCSEPLNSFELSELLQQDEKVLQGSVR